MGSMLFTIFLWAIVVACVVGMIWGLVKVASGDEIDVHEYIPSTEKPVVETTPSRDIVDFYTTSVSDDPIAIPELELPSFPNELPPVVPTTPVEKSRRRARKAVTPVNKAKKKAPAKKAKPVVKKKVAKK